MDDSVTELEGLVSDWITTPDIAELLDIPVTAVRRLLDDGDLVGIRRGKPKVLMVPRALVDPDIVPHLKGTITLLRDAGMDDVELLVWLFREDDSLPGSPASNLRQGRRAEVRRRAQAEAF